MHNRNSNLAESLNEIFSTKEIELFFNYELNNDDITFLKTCMKEVLTIIPPDAYNCANLSSLLGAVIVDHSKIPIAIMTDHLDYKGSRVFNCEKPISIKTTNTKETLWKGHCWIEFGQYILDISIFRTVYYSENFPPLIKRDIINKYGEGKGAIMIPKDAIEEYGFEYTPCFALNNEQINGLVQGTKEKYLNKN